MIVNDDITDVVEKLSKVDNVEVIILFGSQARGTAGEDSDIDLLVVWRENLKGLHRSVRQQLRRTIGVIPKPLDLLIYSKEEIEIALKNPRSFAYEILEQGRVIYGRFDRLQSLDKPSPARH